MGEQVQKIAAVHLKLKNCCRLDVANNKTLGAWGVFGHSTLFANTNYSYLRKPIGRFARNYLGSYAGHKINWNKWACFGGSGSYEMGGQSQTYCTIATLIDTDQLRSDRYLEIADGFGEVR